MRLEIDYLDIDKKNDTKKIHIKGPHGHTQGPHHVWQVYELLSFDMNFFHKMLIAC